MDSIDSRLLINDVLLSLYEFNMDVLLYICHTGNITLPITNVEEMFQNHTVSTLQKMHISTLE